MFPVSVLPVRPQNAKDKARSLDLALEVAIKLFMRDGFERTRINEISRASGCSTETIYDAYGSKQGLWDHVLSVQSRRSFARAEHLRAQCLGEPCPIARVHRLLAALLLEFCSEPERGFVRILMADYTRAPQPIRRDVFKSMQRDVDIFTAAVEQAGQDGLTTTPNPIAGGRVLASGLLHAILLSGIGFEPSAQQLHPVDAAADIMEPILTEAGRKRLAVVLSSNRAQDLVQGPIEIPTDGPL